MSSVRNIYCNIKLTDDVTLVDQPLNCTTIVIFVFVFSEFLLVLVEDEVNLKVVQVKVVEVHVAGVGCR